MNTLWLAAFVYAMGMILLTQAFTLMYRTTRVPNYSLGPIMTIGAYVTYICVKNN